MKLRTYCYIFRWRIYNNFDWSKEHGYMGIGRIGDASRSKILREDITEDKLACTVYYNSGPGVDLTCSLQLYRSLRCTGCQTRHQFGNLVLRYRNTTHDLMHKRQQEVRQTVSER